MSPLASAATSPRAGASRGRQVAARALDAALEASVIGSFSRVGYLARRRLFGWQDEPGHRGGTALVTGGSSGIGFATASALLERGYEVAIVSRDPARSSTALERLRASHGDTVSAHIADLADLSQVRRVAAEIAASHRRIDVLVHAAGVLMRSFHRTDQGFEATFAQHVLAPFLLTSTLLPQLLAAGGAGEQTARVVAVSSGGMYVAKLDVDALERATPATYRPALAYARAKRAQVELAVEWAGRLAGRPVLAFSMHPGWVDTDALGSGLPAFATIAKPLLRTPEQGADTVVHLAVAPELERLAGELFLDRRPRLRSVVPGTATTPAQRRLAFERVAELTGTSPITPEPAA